MNYRRSIGDITSTGELNQRRTVSIGEHSLPYRLSPTEDSRLKSDFYMIRTLEDFRPSNTRYSVKTETALLCQAIETAFDEPDIDILVVPPIKNLPPPTITHLDSYNGGSRWFYARNSVPLQELLGARDHRPPKLFYDASHTYHNPYINF